MSVQLGQMSVQLGCICYGLAGFGKQIPPKRLYNVDTESAQMSVQLGPNVRTKCPKMSRTAKFCPNVRTFRLYLLCFFIITLREIFL